MTRRIILSVAAQRARRREMLRALIVGLVLAGIMLAGGCSGPRTLSHGDDWANDWDSDTDMQQPGEHNAAGGYVDACGTLPGMLGDDC